MDLNAVFDIPLNKLTPDTFDRAQTAKIYQKILSEIIAGTLDDDISDKLSPFQMRVPIPTDLLGVYTHIFRAQLPLYKERGLESDRKILLGTLGVIFHTPTGQSLFDSLDSAMQVTLCDPWVRPMMALAERDSGYPRQALYNLLNATTYRLQPLLVEQFERIRKTLGVPTDIYSVCVGSPNPRFKHLLSQTS